MVRGPWRSKGAGGCSDGDAEGRWDTGARTRRRRALSWWRTWVWDPQRPRGTPALPVCPPKALGDTCCPRPSPEGPGGHLLSPSVPRRPWGTPALPVRPLLLWPMMRDLRQVLGRLLLFLFWNRLCPVCLAFFTGFVPLVSQIYRVIREIRIGPRTFLSVFWALCMLAPSQPQGL